MPDGKNDLACQFPLLLFLRVRKRALSAFAPIVLFAFLLEKLPCRMKFHLPVCRPRLRENLRIVVGELVFFMCGTSTWGKLCPNATTYPTSLKIQQGSAQVKNYFVRFDL